MTTPEIVERAGRLLADATPPNSRVILFGSRARGDAAADSDFDFLVIEPDVPDRPAESAPLRRALRPLRVPIDVIVIDQAIAARRSRVKGAMVHRALREGRVVAES